jgi:dihydroorotase
VLDLLIQGGRVIDPASGFDGTADLLLGQGCVIALEPRPGRRPVPPGAQRLDAQGLIVAPGLIDIHVHLREPSTDHEETIATGTAAAVNGGFSAVACMPNTRPPLDEPDLVERVHRAAAEAGAARVFVVAAATRGRRGEAVTDIARLAEAGAIGFSDDGDPIADPAVMRQVLRASRAAGRCVMQHCQDRSLTRGASMNEGPLADRLGQIGWPAVAEEIVLERDVRLNRGIGCRYHAQHLSSAGSIEILRAARGRGEPVSGEVSPHHLLLTEAACETCGTSAKMNPPLRREADRLALLEGVADGTVTVLATDHAPHPAASKARPFAQASFGVVGLDCALPLYARALVREGVIGWPAMLAMMTVNPAALTGLDRMGLGRLHPGGPGDVTLIDPDQEWTIDPARFGSAGRNCPFEGWTVRGRAVATIVGGRIVMLRAPQRLADPAVARPARGA